MPNKICLFLGYNNEKTKLINFLENNNLKVKKKLNQELTSDDIENIDLIISFGYRKIIDKNFIKIKETNYKPSYVTSAL